MIHHISISAADPHRVAFVLAELVQGRAYRFPGPIDGAAMVVSGDRHGTMVEVYPEAVVLAPTDSGAPFGPPDPSNGSRYAAFHALLSVPTDRRTIERIAAEAGWQTRYCGRGPAGADPLFHVIEVWVENRVLLELAPPALIDAYVEAVSPPALDALGLRLTAA
jgi:hypothetical protein